MKGLRIIFTILFFSLLIPSNCLAFQEHGASEGLYIHQLAHICFGSSMLWLFFMIFRSTFWQKRWWKAIAMGALTLAFWNVLTFIGHGMGQSVDPTCTNLVTSLDKKRFWIWYITKFDTIVACMAMLFFYLGLRRLNRFISMEETGAGKT